MNETDACWLTVEEAMKRYSIRSRRTLQNWQNSENLGFPRPVKYLNRCYYLLSQLREFESKFHNRFGAIEEEVLKNGN
jgi:hypothetical protein